MIYQCGWCLNPFEAERRALAENEALRRVLLIEATVPFEPAICDNCLASVMESAVPESKVVDPPSFLLRVASG